MLWYVEKQLLYGCPDRMDPSCTRRQRLCEYEDNWLCVNVSGFHISQILCQSNILGALTSHCKIFLIISYRNCICFSIAILNKTRLLRMDPISNQQAVTGCSHWLFSLFSQICFTLNVTWRHYSPTVMSMTFVVLTPQCACQKFLHQIIGLNFFPLPMATILISSTLLLSHVLPHIPVST